MGKKVAKPEFIASPHSKTETDRSKISTFQNKAKQDMIQLQADQDLSRVLCSRKNKKKISAMEPLYPLYIKQKKNPNFSNCYEISFHFHSLLWQLSGKKKPQ